MDTNYSDNNHLVLVGKVTSDKRFSHETYGEKFYIFDMEVPRLSDTTDIIPVTASERILNDELLTIGNKLIIKGQNVDKISKVVVVEYQNETKGTSTLVSSTSTEATYQITIPVDYINSGLELYLYGLDDTEITIDNYIIEK